MPLCTTAFGWWLAEMSDNSIPALQLSEKPQPEETTKTESELKRQMALLIYIWRVL